MKRAKSIRRMFTWVLSALALSVCTSMAFIAGAVFTGYMRTFEPHKVLRAFHIKPQKFKKSDRDQIMTEAKRRFALYHTLIQENHLEDGMVVHRRMPDNSMLDECDSLLFSALRYVALNKMQYFTDEQAAWLAIQRTIEEDQIKRHPQCHKPASRDMVMGLLVALATLPDNGAKIFADYIAIIRKNNGFFSPIRTHYNYLTPQIAQLSYKMAHIYNFEIKKLPPLMRQGFLTYEMDSLVTESGYRAHLVALSLWIEMEIFEVSSYEKPLPSRGIVEIFGQLGEKTSPDHTTLQRIEYISQRLVEIDPNNLFFQWLRIKATHAADLNARYQLLLNLLQMPQFPKGALPMDCDRKADHVWMRDTSEALIPSQECSRHYSGVDFLWLSSLMIHDIEKLSWP